MTFATVWFSIDGNEMMKEDMKMLIGLLKPYSTELNLYNNGTVKLYLEVKTDTKTWNDEDLQRKLAGWVFYHPVTMLKHRPKNVTEHDLVDRF